MTREEFDSLKIGDEIELEEETVRVLDIDRMGRVQLVQVTYSIDVFEYQDEQYDTYEEANEVCTQKKEFAEDELEDLKKQLVECVDEDAKDEIQEEIDKLEETIDDLEYADIEEDTLGEPFWMHYKDINIEYN